MRRLSFTLLLLLGLWPGVSVAREASVTFDPQYTAWSALLARNVQAGAVDYAALHRDPRALHDVLDQLQALTPEEYRALDRPQQFAFWINVYNAYTLQEIGLHYPVASIRKIGLLPLAAFRDRLIPLGRLVGKSGALSLNDVENEILRPTFKDPRLHAAIVCASKSCPPLRSEAYVGDRLDRQLDDQMRAFLGDASKNRYDPQRRTLLLSPIFSWFKGDFASQPGGVLGFVARYLPAGAAAAARDPQTHQESTPYDWSLNGR
jgi:hypothetical protein